MIIKSDTIAKLCNFYQYRLKAKELVIFAIRGCLPVATLSGNFNCITSFHSSHQLIGVKPNYQTARCTIGLWDQQRQKVAVFPGSTLPSKKYLFSNITSVETFNILCPGKYELRKGVHPRNGGFQQHDALLMDGYAIVKIPKVERLLTTIKFSGKHKYSVLLPGDNLHAARTEPTMMSDTACTEMLMFNYSSSGCITIAGQPAAYVKNGQPYAEWNYWQHFISVLQKESGNQTHYDFVLFDHSDFKLPQTNRHLSVRYGSESKQVENIQFLLNSIINSTTGLAYYSHEITNKLGRLAAEAYLNFDRDFNKREGSPEIKLQQFFKQTKHFYSSFN